MAGGDANKRNYKKKQPSDRVFRIDDARKRKQKVYSLDIFFIFVYSKTKTDWKKQTKQKNRRHCESFELRENQ